MLMRGRHSSMPALLAHDNVQRDTIAPTAHGMGPQHHAVAHHNASTTAAGGNAILARLALLRSASVPRPTIGSSAGVAASASPSGVSVSERVKRVRTNVIFLLPHLTGTSAIKSAQHVMS